MFRRKRGLIIKELWQFSYPGRFNNVNPRYIHAGTFSIEFKGRIVGGFDCGILRHSDPSVTSEIFCGHLSRKV